MAWYKGKGVRKRAQRIKSIQDAHASAPPPSGPVEAELLAETPDLATAGKLRFVAHPDVPSFDGLDDLDPRGFRREWKMTMPSGKIIRATSLDKFVQSFPPADPPTAKEKAASARARREKQERSRNLRRMNAETFRERREAFDTLEEERKATSKPWKLSCATLLERLPVLYPDMTPEEDAYQASLIKRYRDFAGGLDVGHKAQ